MIQVITPIIFASVLSDQKCSDFDPDDKEEFDCLSVDKKGLISSGPNQCHATILVTSVERFGVNQTLALHVLASFHYIQVCV